MTWIRLLSLLGHLYKRKILGEIGSLVGRVAKLDLNTINRTKGRSARMVIYVNLDKPLVSQIRINGEIQKFIYESFPTICFKYGRYGHAKEVCTMAVENRLHREERSSSEIRLMLESP